MYVANSAFPLTFDPITSSVNIMGYLPPCKVAQAVHLLQGGSSVRLVARSVIPRAWWIFRQTDQLSRRAGQGCRRAAIHQHDRYLILPARRFGCSTARSLHHDLQRGTGVQISDQTVRNRLYSSELWSQRPFVGLILVQPGGRLPENTRIGKYAIVLFTNGRRFNLSGSDGRVRAWWSTGERYQVCNIVQQYRFGGGSVMVWGGISLEGGTDLHVFNHGKLTCARYRDEILRL